MRCTLSSMIATVLTAVLIAPPRARAELNDESLREASHKAISSGLEWLKSVQRDDGAWSNPRFPALTALPLWAFAQSDDARYSEVAGSAIDFLLSCVREDGGIYVDVPGRKGGGLSTYNTAIAMTALHATGRSDLAGVVLRAREFVAGAQHFGDDVYRGGFGYDRETERPYTDLMNTHFALEAMRRTQSVEELRPSGERVDIDWDAALQYVDSLQNPPETGPEHAGGFFYNPADPKAGTVEIEDGRIVLRSYGSITYAGMLALVYARVDRADPRVTSALDWAARHWTLEENPGMGAQGLYFFYNVISRALNAGGIERLRRAEADPIAWREELARAVIERQNPEGFWVNEVGRFWENDAVLSTAYSVLALQMATDVK